MRRCISLSKALSRSIPELAWAFALLMTVDESAAPDPLGSGAPPPRLVTADELTATVPTWLEVDPDAPPCGGTRPLGVMSPLPRFGVLEGSGFLDPVMPARGSTLGLCLWTFFHLTPPGFGCDVVDVADRGPDFSCPGVERVFLRASPIAKAMDLTSLDWSVPFSLAS